MYYMKAHRSQGELLLMSREEQKALSWEDAWDFVERDTLQVAAWTGIMKRGLPPYSSLCVLLHIDNGKE